MADGKQICEAALWLSQCIFDIQSKLELSPFETVQLLHNEEGRVLNQVECEVKQCL